MTAALSSELRFVLSGLPSMDPRALLFALPLLLIALLLAALAGYAFRHRQQTGALTLGLLLLAMAEWSAG
ncbi:MAG: hypothetical protein NZP34_14620, partial [Caldilineales bacterium]|nr:hypothetical protein [Caldilineales bacterium]